VNNAELIVKMLEDAGVRWVFGIPSGPVLPLVEALRASSIEYVITAHESAAGFMASVVGEMTGVPGVCVSTLGPGATNLATGVGAAWLDRRPVIAITCNVPTAWLDRRIQMRIDHHALFGPLTKVSFPTHHGDVREALRQALWYAKEEPPGPVHLDFPEDVLVAPVKEEHGTGQSHLLETIEPTTIPDLGLIFARAKRPLFALGLTITRSHCRDDLLAFIEQQHIPFVTTLHAKGFLPESHPNWGGVLGRARRSDVQKLVDQSDLILTIGFDPVEINYEEWAGERPIVHVSSETADAGPGLNLVVNEICDLNAFAASLARLPVRRDNGWDLAELAEHRRRFEQNLRPKSEGFSPAALLDRLKASLPADAILAYDVGAHTHQIASQWRVDAPGQMLATNGWSSMGYGIPAAFAAKLVRPEATVVAVVGDGGFQMTAGELAVGHRLGLSVPIIVLNDGWYALMKVKQEHRDYAYSGSFLGPPVEPPEHYFGVPCKSVHNEVEFESALGWALSVEGPSVIEAFIDVETYSRTVFD
jgi:acetolactate synthase-1/2/3 large subunit